ncbi:hypothetical protein AMELA_G00206190 [Ameiurus melas]|uniref:Uncharacterized protein n=1 Tax=Ameiurus melas TaxID=219545 RepID=A0A7J6A781_AMEME|nr:hypothetical protein AMELA_G00206190 [Ameiurus melas]
MRAKTLSKELVNRSSTKAHTSPFHVFNTGLCLVLSLFSVVFCVVITLRTSHLEHRMQFLESERVSVLSSAPPSLQAANLSLWDAIEKLVHKRLMEEAPKLRTPREVGQECSCPPGKSLVLVTLFRNILDQHAPTGQNDLSLATSMYSISFGSSQMGASSVSVPLLLIFTAE